MPGDKIQGRISSLHLLLAVVDFLLIRSFLLVYGGIITILVNFLSGIVQNQKSILFLPLAPLPQTSMLNRLSNREHRRH